MKTVLAIGVLAGATVVSIVQSSIVARQQAELAAALGRLEFPAARPEPSRPSQEEIDRVIDALDSVSRQLADLRVPSAGTGDLDVELLRREIQFVSELVVHLRRDVVDGIAELEVEGSHWVEQIRRKIQIVEAAVRHERGVRYEDASVEGTWVHVHSERENCSLCFPVLRAEAIRLRKDAALLVYSDPDARVRQYEVPFSHDDGVLSIERNERVTRVGAVRISRNLLFVTDGGHSQVYRRSERTIEEIVAELEDAPGEEVEAGGLRVEAEREGSKPGSDDGPTKSSSESGAKARGRAGFGRR